MSSERLRLELKRASAPFIAWVVVAVCGLVAVGWVLANQNTIHPWQKYVTMRATFLDVKGVLPKKQEVRIAGVRVGVIKDAEIVAGRPVLTLAIEKQYAPIYRDARLRLRSQTAVEDKYVNLDRGHPAAGRLGANDVVPIEHTTEPVDVSRILQTFDADTRDRLRFFLAGLGRGVGDGGDSLRRAFVEIAPFLHVARDATQQLAIRRRRLADLVTRTARLTSAIGQHDRALTKLVTSGNATLSTLGSADTRLDATLRALPPMLDSIDRGLTTFGRLRASLDPALQSLRPSAQALAPAMTALEHLSTELRPAARALTPAASALEPLAGDLAPLSRDLASTLSSLRPQAPDLDAATKQLDACHDAYTKFFRHTLSLFKLDDDHQAIGRGEVTVGPFIKGTTRGVPPDQVGLTKPQPQGTTMTGGLTRTTTCTERAGVSNFKTKDGGR